MENKAYSNKEKEQLMELLEQGGGIQKVVDIAYKIIENPFVIFDVAYNLLAHTENTVIDDPLWNELTENGVFSQETVDFINSEGFIEAYAKADTVFVLKSSKLKYDRADGVLFDKNGLQIGSIIVVACYRPLEDNDLILLERICEIISAELQKNNQYNELKQVFPKTFMSDLIEGENVDKIQLEGILKDLYSELKTNLYMAVVDVVQYEPTLTHLVYFKDTFEKLQSEFKYYVYLNNVVILISTDNPILSIKQDLIQLHEFFRKYKMYAGISGSFQNLFEVKKYYKQAISALNYGMKDNDGNHIFKYDNYRFDDMLDTIQDNVNINEMCNPVVTLIKEYDKENNTIFYDIIRTSFFTGGNTQLASTIMKMDHDKFCAQLNKINDIFDINWDNGNMRLSIFLSIKILEFYS